MARGYVEMVREMKGQLDAQGVAPDSIVCCPGSGGTLAGVLMGVALEGDRRETGTRENPGR